MVRADDRIDSVEELLLQLVRDPVAARRSRLLVGAGALAVGTAIAFGAQSIHRRRVALEQQVAALLKSALSAQSDAKALSLQETNLRSAAIHAYDSGNLGAGDAAWTNALQLNDQVGDLFQRSVQSFEAALTLDPRTDIRAELANTFFLLAERADAAGKASERDNFILRLTKHDPGGPLLERLNSPARLFIGSTTPNTTIDIEQYLSDSHGRLSPHQQQRLVDLPASVSLPAGSYRLVGSAPGFVNVNYPILLRHGEGQHIQVDLPPINDVPSGYVYIPAGRFLFGDRDESLRQGFLNTTPLHELATEAFLIARHETTYAEWIAFLEDLPIDARRKHLPRTDVAFQGALSLEYTDGHWTLTIRPVQRTYTARFGEAIHYAERSTLATQDWRHFPVSGISVSDMQAYFNWLAARRNIHGARLCTEREWERAARGADDRSFPHGNYLAPNDANFAATYGRRPMAFGPDAVGSHPLSVSPFGVEDMAGNVMEITKSSFNDSPFAIRGGSYYYNDMTQRSGNREPTDATVNTAHIGLRVCVTPSTIKPGTASSGVVMEKR